MFLKKVDMGLFGNVHAHKLLRMQNALRLSFKSTIFLTRLLIPFLRLVLVETNKAEIYDGTR